MYAISSRERRLISASVLAVSWMWRIAMVTYQCLAWCTSASIPAARLKKDACDTDLAQVPADQTSAGQDPRRERRIVDDLWNPILADELEVAVRETGT